jgi:hypothetical protein
LNRARANREPRYNGRTLSEWLEDAQAAYAKCSDPQHPEWDPAWAACSNAVSAMASEAIPFLLNELVARESKLKPRVADLASQKAIAAVLKRKWLGQLRQAVTDDEVNMVNRRLRATFGFALLQRKAKGAEPRLVELTNDHDRETRFWGFVGFATTLPRKEIFMPVAVRLLRDPDAGIRDVVGQCVQELYPEEAEKAGVYLQFPELRPGLTNHGAPGNSEPIFH